MHAEYSLVITPTLGGLIDNVNEAIKHGYTTIGGPFQSQDGNFVQAIIKSYSTRLNEVRP